MSKFKCMAWFGLAVILQACASAPKEIKAPCDFERCKNRTNVNTWYKEKGWQ